jgi:hypothetical protein
MNKCSRFFWFFVMIGLAGVIPTGGAAKDLPVSSQWLSSPVNIDGASDDWADGTFFHQAKMNVDISFRNNKDILFVLFKFKDRKFMSSVSETGLTMWFNNAGKEKKQYGILFKQQSVPAEAYIEFLEKQGQTLSQDKKQEMLKSKVIKFYNTHVLDKKGKFVGPPRDGTEYKPAFFRFKMEKKLPSFEFAIPLERVEKTHPGVGCTAGSPVTIGFEWGGMTDDLRKKNLEKQAQSGGRGRGPGETGFSNSNSGMVPKEAVGPKIRSFWVDVLLAGN